MRWRPYGEVAASAASTGRTLTCTDELAIHHRRLHRRRKVAEVLPFGTKGVEGLGRAPKVRRVIDVQVASGPLSAAVEPPPARCRLVLGAALRSLGLEAEFRKDGNAEMVELEIENGRPVLVGYLSAGNMLLGEPPMCSGLGCGHWAVISGYSQKNSDVRFKFVAQ